MLRFLPLVMILGNFAVARAVDQPMVSQIDNLYIPQGFDNNDLVEVVISGHFISTCYQLGEPVTHVDHATRTISITPIYYKDDTISCLQLLSPYTQVVKLGKMDDGVYFFRVTNNPHVESTLQVKRATNSNRDDFLYPPIEYANIFKNIKGESILELKGRYPLMKRGCMKTRHARIDFQNQEIIIVQPKSGIYFPPVDGTENGCESDLEVRYRLPFAVNGKVLIHVRSINGQSYNRVIEAN